MTTTAAKPKTGPRTKIEEQIALRIIDLLDQGNLPPWDSGWTPAAENMNAVSGSPYRGINRWLTAMTQMECGYQDHRWLTFNQAKKLGGSVRRGEKGTAVVFWKPPRGEDDDGQPEDLTGKEPQPRKFNGWLLRGYTVFNAEQTEGCALDPLEPPGLRSHDPIEAADLIIAGMPQKPQIETYGNFQGPPHYIPSADCIKAPDIGLYKTPERWYGTIFHELVHATGHGSRLNRFKEENRDSDLHGYGKEEMTAGMGTAMLSAVAGISGPSMANDAAYVKSWRDAISADKGMVIRAASLAQKAVDFITGSQATNAA